MNWGQRPVRLWFVACALAAMSCLAGAGVGYAADLAGGWKGTWTKNGDALPVTVSFAKSLEGYSGSFDSDALQVVGIPFAEVSDVDGKVRFLLKGDQSTATFEGALAGDRLAGEFVDGSDKGTFALERASLPARGIRARDVSFTDKAVTLAGTLLLPAGSGKHFAVLCLQGSGGEGRWANHYLAQKFAEAGIASLIYDKRGVGKSTGDWRQVGFDALADDAVAGIRFLQSQAEVDGAHVGIYGHSQGGTIAPLVAARAGDLGFVIASAAGGLAPADIETYSVENSIGLSRLSPAEQQDARAYVRALIDVAYRGKDRAALDALAARFKTRDWYFDPPPPGNFYWTIARQIASFDPARYWRQVRAPVLLLYGAHDERVPPVESANAIRSALASGANTRLTLKMFPDADHTFTLVGLAPKGGWPLHVPDYAALLTAWISAAARR